VWDAAVAGVGKRGDGGEFRGGDKSLPIVQRHEIVTIPFRVYSLPPKITRVERGYSQGGEPAFSGAASHRELR
jgi:hypothetical protein